MAARRPEAAPAPDDAVTTVLIRIVARYIVSQAPGTGSATFRQIATQQLRVATDAEVSLIEQWLEEHS